MPASSPAAPEPKRRSPLSPPSAVELVLSFVNTRPDGSGREEALGDARALMGWMTTAGVGERDVVATEADAAAARELRDALVTLFLVHSGDRDAAASLDAAQAHLRRAASRHPLVPVVTAEGSTLVSEQSGIPGLFGTVLAAVSEVGASDAWTRLKACRNPPCHFGFYDRTRNGAAVYCSPGCGSQASMRAMRERRRLGSAAEKA